MQAIAAAALDGELDPHLLTSLDPRSALDRLQRVRGIAPWTAEAILVRGCGTRDVLPLGEPTLHAAVAAAYGLASVPNEAELMEIAQRWSPFRTWASVLLIASLGRPTSAKRGAPSVATPRPKRVGSPELQLLLAMLRPTSKVA